MTNNIEEIFLNLNEEDIRQIACDIRAKRPIDHSREFGNVLWQVADWIQEKREAVIIDDFVFDNGDFDLIEEKSPTEMEFYGESSQEHDEGAFERLSGHKTYLENLIKDILSHIQNNPRIKRYISKDFQDILNQAEAVLEDKEDNQQAEPLTLESDESFHDSEEPLIEKTTRGETVESALIHAHTLLMKIRMHSIGAMPVAPEILKDYKETLDILAQRIKTSNNPNTSN